jgi:hypothetical protein
LAQGLCQSNGIGFGERKMCCFWKEKCTHSFPLHLVEFLLCLCSRVFVPARRMSQCKKGAGEGSLGVVEQHGLKWPRRQGVPEDARLSQQIKEHSSSTVCLHTSCTACQLASTRTGTVSAIVRVRRRDVTLGGDGLSHGWLPLHMHRRLRVGAHVCIHAYEANNSLFCQRVTTLVLLFPALGSRNSCSGLLCAFLLVLLVLLVSVMRRSRAAR